MSTEHAERAQGAGTGPVIDVTLPLHQGTLDVLRSWASFRTSIAGNASPSVVDLAQAIEEVVAESERERRLSEMIAEARAEHGNPSPERVAQIRETIREAEAMWLAEQEEAAGEGDDAGWHAPLAG